MVFLDGNCLHETLSALGILYLAHRLARTYAVRLGKHAWKYRQG